MRTAALLVPLVMVMIPLAGCMDGDSGPAPRTHEFTLIVDSASSESIPLYTMNDGVSKMMVAALGFKAVGQDALEVPNPQIRVKEGDTVILTVINNNPLPHTLHLHGGLVPWEMDGVPFLNQLPIAPGQQFTYEFKDLKAGTYFYHCHVDVAHHMDLGMYGAFIVEEREERHEFADEYVLMLDEWDNCHVHGNTDPLTGAEQTGEFSDRAQCLYRFLQDNLAQNQYIQLIFGGLDPLDPQACAAIAALPPEVADPLDPLLRQFGCGGGHRPVPPQQTPRSWYPMTFPIYNPSYNTFLINGKAFPDTAPLAVTEGGDVKFRLINVGEEMHSMHLHGHNMLVTHRDGYPLAAPFRVDTLGIMPGERYDVIVETDNPGLWAFHDHVGLNVMNDLHAPGGMFTCMAYDGFHGLDAYALENALQCYDHAETIFGGHMG